MQIKKGIPVSPGVAVTRAVVIDAEDQPIPRRVVKATQVPAELARLDKAVKESTAEIAELEERATVTVGPELAKIFGFHLGLINDPSLRLEMTQMIERDHVTAEFAVYTVMLAKVRMFQSLESKHFQDRDADILDLQRRVLGHLIGTTASRLDNLTGEVALVAHDLTPSQTATLDKNIVKALVTDAGGRTSHTAIMAHALGIPAIVGLEDITSVVTTGETIIVDGNRGMVITSPDASQLLQARQTLERAAEFEGTLDELAGLPSETTDGTEIKIWTNIEFPSEIEAAIKRGAVGVGLYRTEFLFLASDHEPSEDEQTAAYREAIARCDGRPLTIRTLDLGADKLLHDATLEHFEHNPFLGCRSIRLCLQNLPLFKTQLRAILRASVNGPVRIMFPLISSVMELRQARMILNDVMEDLQDEGVAFRQNIPVGIMIEVPSAALQATTLAGECDFFSIGTNDLVQYTLAVDRANERIASLYSAAHPAVLMLIKEVVRAASRANIDVSLCGEMAGEPEYVMLLIGMGLRNLSVTPPAIPGVKRVVRAASSGQCLRIARKVASFETDREVLNYLRDETRRVVPEALDGRSIDA
jgi:phosphotransferase system enzyme I (PtsI)